MVVCPLSAGGEALRWQCDSSYCVPVLRWILIMDWQNSASPWRRGAVSMLRRHALAGQMWHLAGHCPAGSSFELEEEIMTWLTLLVREVCTVCPMSHMTFNIYVTIFVTVIYHKLSLMNFPCSLVATILHLLAGGANQYWNVSFCILVCACVFLFFCVAGYTRWVEF